MTPGFQNLRFQIETEDGHNVDMLREEEYTDNDGDRYKIPLGQDSDGGSEPPILWGPPFNLPPFGKEWRPYVLHDSAYRNKLLKWVNGEWILARLSKVQCDNILFNAMVLCGVSFIRRSAIIEGLKKWGGSSFAEDRKV